MKELVTGKLKPHTTEHEKRDRELEIVETVEHYLPDLSEAMKQSLIMVQQKKLEMPHAEILQPTMVIKQACLADDYYDDEMVLLGMLVKYAGILGVELIVSAYEGDLFGRHKDNEWNWN